MKYDSLISDLEFLAYNTDTWGLPELLLRAVEAIKELQSTVVIVSYKGEEDGSI